MLNDIWGQNVNLEFLKRAVFGCVIAISAGATGTAALAETLPVAGIYPARSDAAAAVKHNRGR